MTMGDNPAPGATLPETVWVPSEVQLFRFSAATLNPHRIHFDLPYAQQEGYEGVLVQSHLHACVLGKVALDWAGENARITRIRWQNRRPAFVGDVLTCRGRVTEVDSSGGRLVVSCELEIRNQEGDLCTPGWITLATAERGDT